MAIRSSKLPSWAKHADFIVLDLACLAVAFTCAFWVKFGNLGFVESSQWRALFIMLLLADLTVTLITGPYSGIFRRSYWQDIGASLKLALLNFLIACVVFYLFKIGEDYSREMLITTFVGYFLLALACKALLKKLLLSRRENPPADSVRRIILVASSENAEEYEKLVYADDMHSTEVVGFCFPDTESVKEFSGQPVVSTLNLPQLSLQLNADEVLITVPSTLVGSEVFESLIEDGVRISIAIDETLGFSAENQTVGNAGALRTLDLDRYAFGSGQIFYLPIKRIFDIAFGALGCLVTIPVAVLVKVAYLINGDNHPIMFRQTRIGLRGQPFEIHKFRSMVWNADEVLEEMLEDPIYQKQWEEEQKFEDDPRVTGVGKFLRRTSLDEFPQFWNVLKGDMSVVGPRPLLAGELEAHDGRSLYNKVKPGITGWWGCNGRSNIDYRERLELEYYYVRNCSLYLDVICVFRTTVAIFKREGAQ